MTVNHAELQHPNVLFLSHGGGPLPLLGDAGHRELVSCLKTVSETIRRPSAIILISAHWEERQPTITAGATPPLIYDYYGFPEESYSIQYPCAGEPVLAERVCQLLCSANMDARLDTERGFDHGMFVPLKVMYPDADIPCIQLSLLNSLDPRLHLDIGRALQQLNNGNLLVIGSGQSFHNMAAFRTPETEETRALSNAFETWLLETCSSPDLDEGERARRLIGWADAPGGQFCHPREEHLLPLHVCMGLAGTHCSDAFQLRILNRPSSIFLWNEQSR